MRRLAHPGIMRQTESDSELYGPAMSIGSREDARLYLARLIRHGQRQGMTRKEAAVYHRAGLGYHAGYYGNETRARVERLFRCAHPYFGAIAVHGPPDLTTVWQIGHAIGRALARRSTAEA